METGNAVCAMCGNLLRRMRKHILFSSLSIHRYDCPHTLDNHLSEKSASLMPSVNFIEAQLSRAAVASCAECLILMVIDGHVSCS